MYNIAITKENKTEFYDGADGKPRPYPTLADALVSAQYLGLTRQDVELHFVKEGASIEAVTKTTTAVAKPKRNSAKKDNDKPAVSEQDGGGKPLAEMNHDELVACAKELDINTENFANDDEIRAAIQAAKELDIKTKSETPPASSENANSAEGSNPQV